MIKKITLMFSAACVLACGHTIKNSDQEQSMPNSASVISDCQQAETYLCLDFEGPNPAGISFSVNTQIVKGVAYSGEGALHFYSDNKKDNGAPWYGGFITTEFEVPGSHWGRLYYRVDAIENAAAYTHITFMAATTPVTDVRLVDTVRGPDGTHQYLYNFPDDKGGRASSYLWRFDDQWVCVEWHVDAVAQRYEFYRDGQLVEEISGDVAGDHGGIPAQFTRLYFGGQVYQKGPEVSGWLDDIVVSPKRSPCL